MNAKEQNNMENELKKNIEEAPVSGDNLNTEEISTENNVTDEVVAETVVEEIQETEKVEIVDDVVEEIPVPVENNTVKEVDNKEKQTSNKRILQGVVVSNKSDKTILIKVIRQVAHPLYKKYYKKSNKFMANDPNNDCNIGDTVKVIEARPLSRRKRWELIEIVDRAK